MIARRPLLAEVPDVEGDEEFSASYRSSLGRLIGFFRAKGVPRDEAADLANETIVRMLVHLKRHGRDRTDLGPLVRTIARNLLIERVRKQTPTIVPLGDDIDVADDALEPDDQLLASERRDAVRTAIASLSPRHRHVVGLWMDGRTPGEIARELGIKRNAVDAILHRARRSLAAKLDGGGVFGLFGIATLRFRMFVRRLTEFVAAADPTGSATTTTLAAAGLAAALTFVGPVSTAVAQQPSVGPLAQSIAPGAKDVAGGGTRHDVEASTDTVRDAVRSAPHRTYEMRVGDLGMGQSGDSSQAPIAEVSFDPEKNGRGRLDAVLENVFKGCVSSGACMETRR